MLDHLSEKLQRLGANLTLNDKGVIDAEAADTICRELRRILLEADVSLSIAKGFVASFKEKILGERVYEGLDAEQHVFGLLNEELTRLFGEHHTALTLEASAEKPALVLLFGLQGSGKTTTIAKLAKYALETKQAKKPLLVAADVNRPAAAEQLALLGQQVVVPVYQEPENSDMLAIVENALEHAKANGNDLVLVDTAGRQQIDTEAMADLLLLERSVKPSEKLLVVDAMLGQQAVAVADAFHTQLGMTGLILTKMDGDTRGGALLSVVQATACPVKLLGTGETMDDLDAFHPDRMASRILGRGDIISLFEKAQARISEQGTQGLQKRLFSGKGMSFTDYLKLQGLLSRLGSLDQLMGMLPIPGLDAGLKQQLAGSSQAESKRLKVLVNSMTKAERQNPDLLSPERVARIAHGSGIETEQAKEILKPFYYMRHTFQQMGSMLSMFGLGGGEEATHEANNPFDWFSGAGASDATMAQSQVTVPEGKQFDPITGRVKKKKSSEEKAWERMEKQWKGRPSRRP